LETEIFSRKGAKGLTAGPSAGRDASPRRPQGIEHGDRRTVRGTVPTKELHDVAAERTPHDYGITAGMSVMLGLIENMANDIHAPWNSISSDRIYNYQDY